MRLLISTLEGLSASSRKEEGTISNSVYDIINYVKRLYNDTEIYHKVYDSATTGSTDEVIDDVVHMNNLLRMDTDPSHNSEKSSQLIIGKSWGGYETTKILDRLAKDYKNINSKMLKLGVVFVDSHGMFQSWFFRSMKIKPEWRKLADNTLFNCIYQKNSPPRGTKFKYCDTCRRLYNPDVDHFNIVNRYETKSMITSAIIWAAARNGENKS